MSYNNNNYNSYDDQYNSRGHDYRDQKLTKIVTTVKDLDLSQRFRTLSFESQRKWEELMLVFMEFGTNYCQSESKPTLKDMNVILMDLETIRKNNIAKVGTKRQDIKGDNPDIHSMQDELTKLRKQLEKMTDSTAG